MKLGDFSDNNALPLPLAGLEGALLKLYPVTNTRGHAWLVKALAQVREWQKTHPDFILMFYAADSTPAWASIKGAAASIGIDLRDYGFGFDLLEWGISQDSLKASITAAHADGVICGSYYRHYYPLGQDWDWPSINAWVNGYVGEFRNPILIQKDTTPFDQDFTDLDREAWLRATVASHQEEDVTPDQVNAQIAAALSVLKAPNDSSVHAQRWQGFYDRQSGLADPRKPDVPHYMEGWNLPTSVKHKHNFAGVTGES